jgi:hypothetical protein
MAKFFELTEENQSLVDEKFQEAGLHNTINLLMFGTPKSKEMIKVSRVNPLAETVGNCPESVVCIIYEEAFDRLDDHTKELLVEDAFANVAYDPDKDKIVVGAPQIIVTAKGRQQYGDELINAAESAIYAIAQIEEEKKAQKELEKENKKKKN